MTRYSDENDDLGGAGGRRYDEDVWTPAQVGKALVWALRLARSVAGPTGPRGYGSGMPDVVYTADEIREMVAEDQVVRVSVTAAKISRMEDVLHWQGRYLASNAEAQGASRVLKVWLRCRANRSGFGAECRRRGWAERTAYRRRDEALSIISQGLDRDQIPLFRV